MKVTVETISPVKRALVVEVEADVVGKEFASAYAELSRSVKIAGFRQGKAPLPLLEKRYHQEIADDVVRRLVPHFYEEAVKEAGLAPVQLPTIDQLTIGKDAPLSFRATVEVRPPVALQPYQDLPVVRRPVVVTDADVTAAVDALRQRHAQLEVCADDHAVAEGDYAVIDFEGTVDGQPLADSGAKGYLVHVGGHAILPELETALIGRRKGERFETSVSFPPDHHAARFAGRLVVFHVAVIDVKRQVLPPLDDEFAKDLGADTLDALRAKIRAELERRRRDEQQAEEKRALLTVLLDRHQVELPPSLVRREADLVRERIARHLDAAGAMAGGPGIEPEALDREAVSAAEERVKGDLLLEAIAEREGLTVGPEEIDQEVERLAKEARSNVQEVRRLLAGESGAFTGLRATLLREKTLDWLHTRAKFREEEGAAGGQEPK